VRAAGVHRQLIPPVCGSDASNDEDRRSRPETQNGPGDPKNDRIARPVSFQLQLKPGRDLSMFRR
jgi:hypothetical protein